MIPHNLDAEADVLASAITQGPDRAVVLTSLCAEDFYAPLHRRLFQALLMLVAEGSKVDATTVAAKAGVDRKQVLSLIGQAVAWGAASKTTLVAECAARRRMLAVAGELTEKARDLSAPFAESLDAWVEAPERIRAPEIEPVAGEDIVALESGEEAEFVIPGVLRRRERVVLTGGEGAGKSHFGRYTAMFTAAGVHVFTGGTIPKVPTLLVDLENEAGDVGASARQIAKSCAYSGGCHAKSRPQGLDLLTARDARWLESLIAFHEPGLVVIGPLYKMYRGSEGRSKSSEEAAEQVAHVLDDLRVKFDCALWIEAHAPHGEGGNRDRGRPRGSALWMGWPNFGFWFNRLRDNNSVAELAPWRGHRHRGRKWPWGVREGKVVPWEPVWEKSNA